MGPTFNRPVADASHHQAAQAYVVAGDYKKAARLYEEAQHVREAVENFLQAEPWNPWNPWKDGIGLERAPATLDLTLESGGLSTKHGVET